MISTKHSKRKIRWPMNLLLRYKYKKLTVKVFIFIVIEEISSKNYKYKIPQIVRDQKRGFIWGKKEIVISLLFSTRINRKYLTSSPSIA